MSIGPGSPQGYITPVLWAATDPVPPVQDLNIPIPHHKPPPLAEDFRRRRDPRRHPPDTDAPADPRKPDADGHIDDYA